jgi:hypothetical protein
MQLEHASFLLRAFCAETTVENLMLETYLSMNWTSDRAPRKVLQHTSISMEAKFGKLSLPTTNIVNARRLVSQPATTAHIEHRYQARAARLDVVMP